MKALLEEIEKMELLVVLVFAMSLSQLVLQMTTAIASGTCHGGLY